MVELAARPSLLDPFRDHMRARLDRYGLPATPLLGELHSLGFGGGLQRQQVSALHAPHALRPIRPVGLRREARQKRQVKQARVEHHPLTQALKRHRHHVVVQDSQRHAAEREGSNATPCSSLAVARIRPTTSKCATAASQTLERSRGDHARLRARRRRSPPAPPRPARPRNAPPPPAA